MKGFIDAVLSFVASSVLVRRGALAGALALVQGLSWGQTQPLTPGELYNARLAAQHSSFVPAPGGGYVRVVSTNAPLPGARLWQEAMGKIVATDAVTVAARAGPMAVSVAQAVTPANAARAAARCLVGGVPLCAVGGAAYLAWELYRVHEGAQFPGTPCGAGELCWDPGTAQETVDQYCTGPARLRAGAPTFCAASVAAAVDLEVADYNASRLAAFNACPRTGTWVCTLEEAQRDPADATAPYNLQRRTRTSDYTGFNGAFSAWAFWQALGATASQQTQCPASIDASNPAYSVPAGTPPGPDGKCKTARYNHQPVTVDQAVAKRDSAPLANDPSHWLDALKDAVASGVPVPAEITSQGPASQTGQPTSVQTTNPQGTTTTTTTPTYQYQYNGDTINVTTSITTNTCTGAGSCTTENATTSTTTTEPPSSEDNTDPKDPCTANPTRAGCVKLGNPEGSEVPKQQLPITYQPVQMAGGTCPAAVPFVAFGAARNLEFQPLCDAASTWVRGIVLLLGAAVAAFIFVGGLKS